LFPLFATGVIYYGGKFAGVVDTGGKLPAVSLMPPLSLALVANLPQVSTTLAKLVTKFAAGVIDTGGKFATDVVYTVDCPFQCDSKICCFNTNTFHCDSERHWSNAVPSL
jgi:hypothetical protein